MRGKVTTSLMTKGSAEGRSPFAGPPQADEGVTQINSPLPGQACPGSAEGKGVRGMVGLICNLCGGPIRPSEPGIHSHCAAIENMRPEMASDILSVNVYDEADCVTRPRSGTYVWVTWLSTLMAGEVGCHWAPWFKAHHTEYTKAPSDFQLAVWTAEHTQLLDELAKERSALDESGYKENQNHFRLRRSSGQTIAGRPDLIAVDGTGHATVYDAKTGKPRHSHIIQIMLYMMCLPYASPVYKGRALQGCVVYRSGERSTVPTEAIDDAFRSNTRVISSTCSCRPAPRPAHRATRSADTATLPPKTVLIG